MLGRFRAAYQDEGIGADVVLAVLAAARPARWTSIAASRPSATSAPWMPHWHWLPPTNA